MSETDASEKAKLSHTFVSGNVKHDYSRNQKFTFSCTALNLPAIRLIFGKDKDVK